MKYLISIIFVINSVIQVNSQIVQIGDPDFEYALLYTNCVDTDSNGVGDINVDINKNKQIEILEAENVLSLHLSDKFIKNLDGIEYFKNLLYLDISKNNISKLNIDSLINLKSLFCNLNFIKYLNLRNNSSLETINCSFNIIDSLKLSNLYKLRSLNCMKNNLTSLNLKYIYSLHTLICSRNNIDTINIENPLSLKYFDCNENKIRFLNLNNFRKLDFINCENNQLIELYLKTGNKINNLFFYNPTLKYICCNEENLNYINEQLQIYGINDCEVNSYCSFTPGGKFYSILGKIDLDIYNNGCANNDINLSKLKLNISSLNANGSFISNTTGNYFISVQEGTHTIKPVLENPDYFNVSPDSLTVIFPSTSDTIIQDFCTTPKGIYKQVDLSIIPLIPPARPGFDASYKVVMTNNGNQVENGTLYFAYDEPRMDFVNTDVNPNTQNDGLLSWDFTNLLPFETRYYNVTLNVNSPSETPPVNAGDELLITCNILDNVFLLKQEVVGSYDPNDKTCLEGKTITPEQVGEYIHYLIRFENTGNYAAENVVVKDVIDETTFDISTLQITDASHEAWARINDNVVEFIFENIQLPFDDASNDGYICFKIKSKPTLVLGNELKNEANIYFDYNLPILTNKTNTVVANLVGTDEAIGENYIEIYPNPVSDILKFSGDDKILKVEIFDLSGRLVQVSSVVNGEVNAEGLLSGAYQMQVYTQKGVSNGKIVKI